MQELYLIKQISDKDFEEEISSGVTLVDFWAPWCMPCRFQAPILEELAPELHDRSKIRKLNVDENQATSLKFGITGIPTLILFQDGRVVKQFVGLQPKKVLSAAIRDII